MLSLELCGAVLCCVDVTVGDAFDALYSIHAIDMLVMSITLDCFPYWSVEISV